MLCPKGNHLTTLIWLHGLGDSAQGFKDLFLDIRLKIVPETCKVILPTAPERFVNALDMKLNAWFDIKSSGRPKDFTIEAN